MSIEAALAEAGIPQPPAAVDLLARDLAAVLEANKSVNLTSVRDPARAVVLHVVDSLLALPEIQAAPSGAVVDLGAGAGFPGVPIAIATGRPLTLVESVGKKARFLEALVAELALDAAVVNGRAEQVGVEMAGRFSVVVARALAVLPSLVELAAPLLADGGRFIAYKGTPGDLEISRGDAAAAEVGLSRISCRDVTLAGADGAQRSLITYERVAAPKLRLPRRIGLAQNQPLA
jgi:16S rRNA (guanine527-N7)-methyltransferase